MQQRDSSDGGSPARNKWSAIPSPPPSMRDSARGAAGHASAPGSATDLSGRGETVSPRDWPPGTTSATTTAAGGSAMTHRPTREDEHWDYDDVVEQSFPASDPPPPKG